MILQVLLVSVLLGSSAAYDEKVVVLPFEVGGQIQLRGYLFFQDIATPKDPYTTNDFQVRHLEDPYGFVPSELHIGEIGVKTETKNFKVDAAFYYSEIRVKGRPDFYANYAGTRMRVDKGPIFIQSAQTLFRTSNQSESGIYNFVLGLKWGPAEIDYTFGDIGPVQADDPFFQSEGWHLRIMWRF